MIHKSVNSSPQLFKISIQKSFNYIFQRCELLRWWLGGFVVSINGVNFQYITYHTSIRFVSNLFVTVFIDICIIILTDFLIDQSIFLFLLLSNILDKSENKLKPLLQLSYYYRTEWIENLTRFLFSFSQTLLCNWIHSGFLPH